MTRRFLVCGLVLTLLLTHSLSKLRRRPTRAKLPAKAGERGIGEDEEVGEMWVAADKNNKPDRSGGIHHQGDRRRRRRLGIPLPRSTAREMVSHPHSGRLDP